MGVPQKGTVSSNLILSATLIKFRGYVGKVTRSACAAREGTSGQGDTVTRGDARTRRSRALAHYRGASAIT